jgi:hypothetical protein
MLIRAMVLSFHFCLLMARVHAIRFPANPFIGENQFALMVDWRDHVIRKRPLPRNTFAKSSVDGVDRNGAT